MMLLAKYRISSWVINPDVDATTKDRRTEQVPGLVSTCKLCLSMDGHKDLLHDLHASEHMPVRTHSPPALQILTASPTRLAYLSG